MIGAIAGDIIGSVYEFNNIKTKDFPLFSQYSCFTDDSVLTVALADAILQGVEYPVKLKEYYRMYPDAGYGARFAAWASSGDFSPYNSWGNGAAMRISPAGFAYDTLEETLQKADLFTAVTHNHPEGIKGAQATAAAIYLARTGGSKSQIKEYVENTFGYDLSRTLDEIRPHYRYDISCQETVPQALTAFLESTGFEDAIRNAVSLGGDCDTLTCITGGVAQAFYGVPESISAKVYEVLPDPMAGVVRNFSNKYCKGEK